MTARKVKGGPRFRVTLNDVDQDGIYTIQDIIDKTEQMLMILSMYGPVKVTYTPVKEAD